VLYVYGGVVHQQSAGMGGPNVLDVGMVSRVAVGEVDTPTTEDIALVDVSHTIHVVPSVSNMVNITVSCVRCLFVKAICE